MTSIDPAIGVADETAGPSNAGNMLIRRLKISGMQSFGPQGIDLPMEPLNVLIGPNGSGKSNFIEALALLQAAPRDLSAPVKRMGGISEWLWKGEGATGEAVVEAVVDVPQQELPLRHTLRIVENRGRFELSDEAIEYFREPADLDGKDLLYRFLRGVASLRENAGGNKSGGKFVPGRQFAAGSINPEESVLSQIRDPEAYPAISWLQRQYADIRLYRNWELGPDAGLRQSPRADQPNAFLTERGENLALLLSRLRGDSRQVFVKSLQQIYDGIEDFQVEVGGGRADLFVVERGAGERYIPASRLSDGTLRYMMLAAILLDPEPPPLVVIEEPELGMHPDVILHIGEMLIEASERTQLVVTTHSRTMIDAMHDYPSRVVVCEKYDGASIFERLKPDPLKKWLEKYSLGNLWSAGDLGGNRW